MFDLFKNIEKYKGITPYASEGYGVYQPILGWESKLTKNWIQGGGILIDPNVKRILDGRLSPGPKNLQDIATTDVRRNVEEGLSRPRENFQNTATKASLRPNYMGNLAAIPLEPASAKSPFKVALTKDLNSEILKLVQVLVQAFVDDPANNGQLPKNGQWNKIIDNKILSHPKNGLLRKVNDIHRNRLNEELAAKVHPIQITVNDAAQAKLLELMQYESQIAAFLLFNAEGRVGFNPSDLNKLFSVQIAPPLGDILSPTDPLAYITDPLANIDPKSKSGALSPVGFVHLFRQYFFDLGTFLGEPVEHIWLAPGTTIELIEVSTRKTIIERTEENAEETTVRSERSTAVKEEISEAIKAENESSTKLGVTTTHTVNYGIYQGTATASLGMESTRKDARENTQKQTREQAEKLSSEIKRSFKSVFKTVTETTDTRSRRYVLQNTGPDLINYELRRKMRRVGVQLQDLGSQLCWQVFIDNAGSDLGLAELVHFAESPDLANLKQPEIPKPAPIKIKVPVPIAFTPPAGHSNDDFGPGANYGDTGAQQADGFYQGHRVNTNDEDAEDARVIMGPFPFKLDPPQLNYELTEVRLLGPQPNQQAIAKPVDKKKIKGDGSFELVMDLLNFGGQPSIPFEVELVFTPVEPASTEAYKAALKVEMDKYDAEVSRLRKKSFMENVRQRIKHASNIKSRPSWDLREEERTIIFRYLIDKLMLRSGKIAPTNPKDGGNNARLSHVRSELIRAIFDVDAMLYFVAPEWWMPRTRSQLNLSIDVGAETMNLTDNDVVKWDDIAQRKDNYRITEESAPAKLGSSLGWLLQLDGDNLRNAFLNAPWVKAVIPIRPGREKAALNWLRSIEGHENDGWNTDYVGNNTPEDRAIIAELKAQHRVQNPTIGHVLEKIADQMEKQNGNIKNVLEADKVFERGFDHLKGGFDAGLPANKVFSQWISVLPTDQIVAVEYEPTNLFEP